MNPAGLRPLHREIDLSADARVAAVIRGIEREQRRRRNDVLLQITIAALSIAAIACISTTGPAHRWGFVIGLLSQPFWIAATWRARQWGMLFLSVFYLFVWIHGIANRFTF